MKDITTKDTARDSDDNDAESAAYNARVGERLRAIRRQKKLSLQEVEAQSHDEFKASVVGAYERGERSISLPRLRSLADFYRVPIEQLLPREPDASGVASQRSKMVLDLVQLAQRDEPEFAMVMRYVKMIQVQRGDFNGKVLTVRADDVRAIAAMLDTTLDQISDRLDSVGILYRPAPTL